MEARISTRLVTPQEETRYNAGFKSTYHKSMEDISQRIAAVSGEQITVFEFEYSMLNHDNNSATLKKAQDNFPNLDLTPLEGTASLTSVKLATVYMIKNPGLFESIKKMHLTVINLFSCFLNDQFLSDFSKFLSGNELLQEVHLSCNEFTPAGCKPLITALMKNKSVKELTLLGYSVADDAALNGWPQLLQRNTALKTVRLAICVPPNPTWPEAVAAALKTNQTLEHISLTKGFGKPSRRLDVSQINTLCQGSPHIFDITDDLTTYNGGQQFKFLKGKTSNL